MFPFCIVKVKESGYGFLRLYNGQKLILCYPESKEYEIERLNIRILRWFTSVIMRRYTKQIYNFEYEHLNVIIYKPAEVG